VAEFATASILYGQQPLDVACREIASVGVRHLDLWHVTNWCEHLRDGPDAVTRLLERYKLRLLALSAYGAPPEALTQHLETLQRLGGTVLVTMSARPDVSVADYAEQIRPLVATATALGVSLAIENHADRCIDSIASMVELTERLPEAGLSIALAPIHLYNRDERTEDAIRALPGRVGLFYLWDWGAKGLGDWKNPAEQFVGTGRIDFHPVLRALRETGYTRPLNIFAHGPEHWPTPQTTDHLQRALARARRLAAEAPA